MTDYLISAETRDQLIDLLEDVQNGKGGYPLNRDAFNILPHLKAAPEGVPARRPAAAILEDAMDAIVADAGLEQADPVTAAKAEADRSDTEHPSPYGMDPRDV